MSAFVFGLVISNSVSAGAQEMKAAVRVVTLGGMDAHCHLGQPMAPPARMAARENSQSLRTAVKDYRRRAGGSSHVPYADMKLDVGQMLDLSDASRHHDALAVVNTAHAGRTAPRFHARSHPMHLKREVINPAKAYRLHLRKSTIAAGGNSNLVIGDKPALTLKSPQLSHIVDYTPHEGMTHKVWSGFRSLPCQR